MPIISIIDQPVLNDLKAAYRPVVFKVRATRTDSTAKPPVVYCDVYVNGIYYKTSEKTQYTALNATNSDWQFDIKDAVQEILKTFLPVNGGSAILEAPEIMASIQCKFRSSGYDANGFIKTEGTAPIQGTGTKTPVAGTGTLSNTFFAVNSTLQHEHNQDLPTHLGFYKSKIWNANVFPLSHRGGKGVVVSGTQGVLLTLNSLVGGSSYGGAFGAITSRNLANGGSGYGGPGGGILTTAITSGGGGYTDGYYPGVPITTSTGSGSGATANVTISSNAISAVAIVNPGINYAPGDAFFILNGVIGGTGSGSSFSVSTVNDNTENYTNVTLTGGSGTGAKGTIAVSSGVVVAAVITAPGTGYLVGNVLGASSAQLGGTGSGLQVNVTGVSSASSATFMGVALTGGSGSGATANIKLMAGVVSNVAIVNGGIGYAVGNILAIGPLNGTGSGFSIQVASVTFPNALQEIPYKVCSGDSDFFPIANLSTIDPTCVRIKYKLKGSSTYLTATNCATPITCAEIDHINGYTQKTPVTCAEISEINGITEKEAMPVVEILGSVHGSGRGVQINTDTAISCNVTFQVFGKYNLGGPVMFSTYIEVIAGETFAISSTLDGDVICISPTLPGTDTFIWIFQCSGVKYKFILTIGSTIC